MVAELETFEFPDLPLLDFCLCRWMKSDVYKRNVDTWDNLLACILDGAARISMYQGCHLNIKLKLK